MDSAAAGTWRRLGALHGALVLALLAGCASGPPGSAPYPPGRDGPEAHPPTHLDDVPDAVPKLEPIRPGGPNKPYEVLGQRYVPLTSDAPFTERGLASWYGKKFQGHQTASGELYNMYAMTAAHRTLPIPSYVRVRNPANGREVIVRVNDRGPFHSGRIIDLSYTAALKLGLLKGVAPVEIERITYDEIRAGAWRHGTTDETPLARAPDAPDAPATTGNASAEQDGSVTPAHGGPVGATPAVASGDAAAASPRASSRHLRSRRTATPAGRAGDAIARSAGAIGGAATAAATSATRATAVAVAPVVAAVPDAEATALLAAAQTPTLAGSGASGSTAEAAADAQNDHSGDTPVVAAVDRPSAADARPLAAATDSASPPMSLGALAVEAGASRPVVPAPASTSSTSDSATAAAPSGDVAGSASAPPIESAAAPARAYTAAARGFWIQLGAFHEAAGALDFQRRVQADLDWLAPLLAIFDDHHLHRLQAGPYASRSDATSAAERIRSALRLVPVIVERR